MFIAFRHWGFLEAVVKQVGSGLREVSVVVASNALGRGYRMVPSVGIFGFVMLSLERVCIW